VNLARAYLHEVTDRAVDLQELARVAGVSRFQLLRNFRDSFGHTPAAYHRQLRLTLAKQAVDECRVDCVTAADRYGFAGGSSFSHAYRRQFGQAPIRTLTKA
jgi:transcriptional regulator GlxA family with amidase domain